MTEISRMTAVLDADIAPFTSGMSSAVSAAGQAVGAISRSITDIGEDFASLASSIQTAQTAMRYLATGLLGGVAAGAVIGFVSHLRDGVRSMGDIARGADAAGVTTDAFQELRYAAERAGVTQKEFGTTIGVFAEKAFQAQNGVGSLKIALDKYNPGLSAAVTASTSLSDALGHVSEAVRGATNEKQRAAIVEAAFGSKSDDLIRFMRGGAAEIQKSGAAAQEFGFILDESVVRRAPEIGKQFDALSNAIGANFQHVLVEAGPSLVAMADAVRKLLEQIVPAVDWIAKLSVGIANVVDIATTSDMGKLKFSQLRVELEKVNAEIENTQLQLALGPTFIDRLMGATGAVDDAKTRLHGLLLEQMRIEEAMQRRPAPPALKRETPTFELPPVKAEEPDAGPSAGALAAAQKKLDTINAEFLKSMGQVTDGLRAQYDVQLHDLDASLEAKLISAGDYIKARAQLEETLTRRMADEAQKQIKPVTDAISGSLSRAFDDFIDRGELNFEEMTRSMLANIAKVAVQMAIIQPLFGGGSTTGGGIVGEALAGVFHDGGVVGAGGGTRAVPGLAFAMAPRFHSGGFPGLRAGEVPAILERGEEVIPKGGQKASAGRQIVFNISTPDVAGFRQSQGQVAAMVARTVGRGQRNL